MFVVRNGRGDDVQGEMTVATGSSAQSGSASHGGSEILLEKRVRDQVVSIGSPYRSSLNPKGPTPKHSRIAQWCEVCSQRCPAGLDFRIPMKAHLRVADAYDILLMT